LSIRGNGYGFVDDMDRSTPAQLPEERRPKIICFGASLTAWSFGTNHGKGFGDVLKKEFEGRAEVVNEGAWFVSLEFV
jgi:uncharacterized membrane protein